MSPPQAQPQSIEETQPTDCDSWSEGRAGKKGPDPYLIKAPVRSPAIQRFGTKGPDPLRRTLQS